MTAEAKGAKTAYINTKHVAKHAVWLAKSEAEKEVIAILFPDGDGVFHIAKHMDRTNQDVVSENWCWSACAHSRTLDAPDGSHMFYKSMRMGNAKWSLHFLFKLCILRPQHTS